MVPAMALEPMSVTMTTVIVSMIAGSASGMKTFQMIWKGVAPMDWAASMSPEGISRIDVSTMRAV